MTDITLPRAELEQVLEALENLQGLCTDAQDGWVEAVTIWTPEIITALRERLAQPEQKPAAEVKLMMTGANAGIATRIVEIDDPMRERLHPGQMLYTTPPQRKPWVELTDEERNKLWREVVGWGDPSHDDEDLMKAIEAKLREKNA